MKFKDDVEFHLESREKKIHFRSASRTGYCDFGYGGYKRSNR
ncbi:DUF1499 domain-containing protein [Metabacillus dongyingensis]